jgi:F0F1-type ATP synthase membrane subunit a
MNETINLRLPDISPDETRQEHVETTNTRQEHVETTNTRQEHVETTNTRQEHVETTNTRQEHVETTNTQQEHVETKVHIQTMFTFILVCTLVLVIVFRKFKRRHLKYSKQNEKP